jgi:DNA gyrase subunit B
VNRRQHGLSQVQQLSPELLAGGDYQQLTALAQQLENIPAPITIKRGERSESVASFEQAYDWLMHEARRGLAIQRYKGLGEMNPEQLWETTLNTANRRLVKVRIEDAVAADQMFTTLMGEDVEPRRDFIERYALLVGNLDV